MVLLKAEHITKKYSGRTIIKDINIELHKGELISLLGVSGSGKTTLFHVLSGLTTPEEGRVLLNGEDITSRACLKNKSYTKHKSYYCLLILKISKINIIYIIIDIF